MTASIVKEIGVQFPSNRFQLRGFRQRHSRQIVTEARGNGQDPALAQEPVDQKIIKNGNFVDKVEKL